MKQINKLLVGSLGMAIGLVSPTGAFAQAGEGVNTIDEVLVTGRKREESLTDVPVSISVFNATALQEQGIDSEGDLFAATPGLDYSNFNGSRQANNPGVRGVQSNLRAANQQKVASFIDGMPMLGNTGSIQFSGVEAVEVYRGPQSAAFGRSTFAGAINYVTADASDELTGKILLRASDLEARELGLLLSGPITENLGYRLSYIRNDWTGPDEWTATDGTKYGSEETEQLTAKINFAFSDTAYGELRYSQLDLFDQEGGTWIADPATCALDSGVFISSMGAVVQLPSDKWDCDLDIPGGNVPGNAHVLNQFLAQYDVNEPFYRARVGMAFAGLDANMNGTLEASEYLGQTLPDGQTYEQALLGQSVIPQNTQEQKRLQGEMNFEFGDHLLQFMGMITEDDAFRWNENDYNDLVTSFQTNMMTGQTAIAPSVMSMVVTIDIEEKYGEVRWISPAEERLRYTLSGSYYDYALQQQVYNNGGAIYYGLVYEGGPNVGQPVNSQPGITISEVATNVGASFGLQYDVNDRTTFSFEGRYQTDEVCGEDPSLPGVTACQETAAFLPRIAFNTTLSDSMSVYGQLSIGNNPAGVNIAYQDASNIEALLIASGQIPVPALAADGVTVPINAGVLYNGVGGNPPPTVSYDASTFPDFEEEKLTNFEVGVKGNFADRRGSYTAAAYFMIYENIIGAENLDWDDSVDGGGGWNEGVWNTYTTERTWVNQGDGEMYGIELTANYMLNDIVTVGGYVTLASAKFSDFCSPQAPNYLDAAVGGAPISDILTPEADGVLSDCSVVDGNWVPKQAPVTANLNVQAFLPNDLFGFRTNFRADIRHKGSYYEDHMNLLQRKPVTTVNLSANMRAEENWTLRFYVDNVTNNQDPARIFTVNGYVPQADPTAPLVTSPSFAVVPMRPREMGFQVQYEF